MDTHILDKEIKDLYYLYRNNSVEKFKSIAKDTVITFFNGDVEQAEKYLSDFLEIVSFTPKVNRPFNPVFNNSIQAQLKNFDFKKDT